MRKKVIPIAMERFRQFKKRLSKVFSKWAGLSIAHLPKQ
jgi:hypothetical protein